MGLDAVVFRNVVQLEKEFGQGTFDVDRATGEAVVKPEYNINLPFEACLAADRRLGNSAEIAILYKLVGHHLALDSIVMRQILYSGSHSGDRIDLHTIPELKLEIAKLRNVMIDDLGEFLDSMEALVECAEREHNPIVFM